MGSLRFASAQKKPLNWRQVEYSSLFFRLGPRRANAKDFLTNRILLAIALRGSKFGLEFHHLLFAGTAAAELDLTFDHQTILWGLRVIRNRDYAKCERGVQ